MFNGLYFLLYMFNLKSFFNESLGRMNVDALRFVVAKIYLLFSFMKRTYSLVKYFASFGSVCLSQNILLKNPYHLNTLFEDFFIYLFFLNALLWWQLGFFFFCYSHRSQSAYVLLTIFFEKHSATTSIFKCSC